MPMFVQSGVRLPFPVVCFSLAIVVAIAHRLLEVLRVLPEDPVEPLQEEGTILVCVVSYDDARCIDWMQAAYRRAANRRRLQFSIVEYVRDADSSITPVLPPDLRCRTHVETHALSSATTVAAAWRTCLDEMLASTTYVCLLTSCDLQPEWDAILCDALPSSKCVLTASPSLNDVAQFPCVTGLRKRGARVHYRDVVHIHPVTSVPAVFVSVGLIFGSMSEVRRLIRAVDASDAHLDAALTLVAHEHSLRLHCPTRLVARVGVHPRRPPPAVSTKGYNRDQLRKVLVYEEEKRFAHAGLTIRPSDSECIAKYGSVTAARVTLQKLEAKIRR